MARAYSLDLRERVIAAVRSGQSRRKVAATFGLEPSTVVK
jgi:transposase